MENLRLKVGDRVETIKERDGMGNRLFPIGTTGIISRVTKGDTHPYRVDAYGDYWYYSDDMLEPAKEKTDNIQREIIELYNKHFNRIKEDIYKVYPFVEITDYKNYMDELGKIIKVRFYFKSEIYGLECMTCRLDHMDDYEFKRYFNLIRDDIIKAITDKVIDDK
jgi:hypothetical protein